MTHTPIKKVLAKAKSLEKRRHSVTVYVPVSKNIYYDGTSYRVRITNNYDRTSRNFKNVKHALKFRNWLRQLAV